MRKLSHITLNTGPATLGFYKAKKPEFVYFYICISLGLPPTFDIFVVKKEGFSIICMKSYSPENANYHVSISQCKTLFTNFYFGFKN